MDCLHTHKRIIVALLQLFLSIYLFAQEATDRDWADGYYNTAIQEQSRAEAAKYYERAEAFYIKCRERTYWDKDSLYVFYSLRLADCAWGQSYPARQLEYTNDAIRSGNRQFLPESIQRTKVYLEAAGQCVKAGDDRQAWGILHSIKKQISNLHDDRLSVDYLLLMSEIEKNAHRFTRAFNLANRAVRTSQTTDVATKVKALVQAMETAAASNESRRFRHSLESAYELSVRDLLAGMGQLTERDRAETWNHFKPYLNQILKIQEEYGWVPERAYDALLLSKGILLNASIAFTEAVEESNDSVALSDLALLKSIIAEGETIGVQDSLEKRILDRLQDIGRPFHAQKDTTTWKNVRMSLGPNDLAIEFYQLEDGRIGTLCLKRDWKKPRSFSLPITDGMLHAGILEDSYAGMDSTAVPNIIKTNQVWTEELLLQFPTDDGCVYFSPVGRLEMRGIEYLPCPIESDQGRTMADCFKMIRLSSTKELLRNSRKLTNDISAGLYGGINYLDKGNTADERRLLDSDFEKEIASPKYTQVGLYSLPGTLKEIHLTDTVLHKVAKSRDLFTGQYASEESFKKNGEDEVIIHFATHGFYEQDPMHISYFKVLYKNKPHILEDPLFHSGLYMAGSYGPWNGDFEQISGSNVLEHDGILTAKEISLLNLRKTSMVVLSACSTAIGEEGGDGLYGLPRAFKKAGVDTVLMSLSPVQDEATLHIMSYFYQNHFIFGMDRYDAFMAALHQLRIDPRWAQHPEVWKSFILLDP